MKRVLLVLCAGISAPAQNTQPATTPASGAPQRIRVQATAVDYSTMLKSSHGSPEGQAPKLTPVPLPDTAVLLLVRGLPGEPRTVPARTDAQGRFTADLGDLPAGATVEFLADRKTGDAPGEKFYARSFQVGAAAPPAEVQFYRVARTPDNIVQLRVMQVVTLKEDKNDAGKVVGRSVFLRQIIEVGNFGFEVWLGDVGTDKPVSYWVPVPEGFELVAGGITVDQRPVEVAPEAMPHGGRGCAWRQPMFPSLQKAHQFVAVLARPCVENEIFELGTHVEYPTEMWSMNLQEGVFAYVAGDAQEGRVQLADAGAQAPMGQSQRVTHAWVAENIGAHSTVNGRVVAGKAPLDKAVLVVVGSIAFVVLGGIAFGFLFRRRETVAAPADPVAVALRQLDDRKRRGEISSVDYAARKAVLMGQAPAAARGDKDSAPAPASAPDLLAQVDAIASRAAGGAEPRVVEDVRILARAVREILTRQGHGPAPRG